MRIVLCHRRPHHCTGIEAADNGAEVEAGHDLFERAGGGDLSLIHQHHGVGQADDLVDIVGHVDDGQAKLVAQVLDERHDLGAAPRIEAGQRLVHQQDARTREQRPPDGDALLLAARKPCRPPLQKRAQVQQGDNRRKVDPPIWGTRAPCAKLQVGTDAQVWEQPVLLKHIAKTPLLRGKVDALLAVEQDPARDRDAAIVGALEPGQHVDERRLAGARAAEQCGQPFGRGKPGIEGEVPEPAPDVDLDHPSPPMRRATRRARNSDATTATSASTIEITSSLAAPASPPGCWVSE